VGVGWGEGGVGGLTAGGVRVEVWHRFALDGVVVCWFGHHGVRVCLRERDRGGERERLRDCRGVRVVVEVECRD
jgi:hypothetical protein